MLMFAWNFEVDAWSRFWRWNLIKICVWIRDMNSRSYFGKMNSILGSVVPLAMFWKWDQSCNFRQFSICSSDAFVREYSSVDLSWHQEVVLTFEGDQVKAICLCQDKYEGAFSERREFWIPLPNSTLHHRCLKSKLEWETLKMRQYELITWVREKNYFWKPSRHKCGQF